MASIEIAANLIELKSEVDLGNIWVVVYAVRIRVN